jgi:hypothetical protein
MKSRSIGLALFSAFALVSPSLTFAGSQTRIYPANQGDTRDRIGVTHAVQQGKGTVVTRNEGVRANAYRSETAADSQTVKDRSNVAGPNWSDAAYRK